MSRRFLSLILGLLVAVVVGCGGTDTVNLNSFNNGTTSGLSGQTGAITLQTMLANNQVQGQEVVVVKSDIIPSFVDELRFTGQDANGFFVWGPVVRPKAAQIELLNVPVEVTTLRIELLVNGFTVGGLVTPINVPSGDVVFLTDPTYVFAGAVSDVVDPTVVFGSFLNDGSFGDEFPFPEGGEYPIEEAPVIDFSIPQVTNGVSRTSPGIFTVSEEGDYLLSYSLEIPFDFDSLLTQIARNNTFVENTRLDIANTEFERGREIRTQEETGLQGFQHIVTLQAGDTVSLRVRDLSFALQGVLPVFGIPGGTFSIVRLGSGGVTGPAPPEGPGGE